MKRLRIDGHDLGVVHNEKRVRVSPSTGTSQVWLTKKQDDEESTKSWWWVIVMGTDQKLRTVGFLRGDPEARARETYDALSKPHVLGAFLEGRDS